MLLTSASANLSLTDKDGNTALHLACSNVSVHKGAAASITHVILKDEVVLIPSKQQLVSLSGTGRLCVADPGEAL